MQLQNTNNQIKTLFIDRDGVINEQIIGGYVMEIEQFVFRKDVLEALSLLRTHFGRVLLVTNQQCVGKGLCLMENIERVHAWMQRQLGQHGCAFDKIYCCPHLASDDCACRKPKPGMAQQALLDFPDTDIQNSVMVGDTLSDMQFARNAGLAPVHVGAVRHPEFEQIQTITSLHFDNLLDYAKTL